MNPTGQTRIPGYGKHRATGQARVILNGRTFYLGRHGTKESKERYRRKIQEWLARGKQLPQGNLTVIELILAFWKHAETYYRKSDGTPTSELSCFKLALRPVKELYGTIPANDFGPQELKTIREVMVGYGWVRKSINHHLGRIRFMFKWAGEQGLGAPEVYHRLLCVSGLKLGRCEAKEGEPVKPVPGAFIDAAKSHLLRPVAALIDLHVKSILARRHRQSSSRFSRPNWKPTSFRRQRHAPNTSASCGANAEPGPAKPGLSEKTCRVYAHDGLPVIAEPSPAHLRAVPRGADTGGDGD